MNCPKCGFQINPGKELSRLAAGKPRTLSEAERQRRRENLTRARLKRWAGKAEKP